jgi:hypothetical protein
MGKLSEYISMKRDLAFDYERELRAVRDLMHGISRLSGSDCTIDLTSTDGFVAGGRARIAFSEALRTAIHDALLQYAHDLAREGLEHGMEQDIVSNALSGASVAMARPHIAAGEGGKTVRLAACA